MLITFVAGADPAGSTPKYMGDLLLGCRVVHEQTWTAGVRATVKGPVMGKQEGVYH